MYQTQFFSEKEINPSLLLDDASKTTGRPNVERQQQVLAPILIPPADAVSIFNFDTPNGSPYTRRYPANEKRRSEFDYEHSVKNPNWTPTNSDEDFDVNVQDMALPIQMERYHSMHSLRSRKDPHFQGNRSRKSRRVIDKTGERNIEYLNIPQRSWIFFKDFVNTLLDEQWRYVIIVFALSFFICWIVFALLWYLIAHANGDLDRDPLTGEFLSDHSIPCVENAYTFAGFLLFSIETQVSIGYGTKYPNEHCPEAIFLMTMQIVVGIAIEGAMVGIVYAKMVRPPKHSSDLKFSKKAVICQRDSKLCLIFRICDSKQNHAIESKVQAYWFEERLSLEGEKLRQFQYSLKLENPGVFILCPVTVCHIIDRNSPLYDLSGRDLLEKKFEIIVTLTGSSSTTAQMTQSRTSYLPKEIFWGHRFVNIISYDKSKDTYVADYDKFDETIVIDTPLCSARRLEEVIGEVNQLLQNEMLPVVDFDPEIHADEYFHNNDELYSPDEKIGDIIIEPIRKSKDNLTILEQENIQNTINEHSETEKQSKQKLLKELEIKLSQHNLNEIKRIDSSDDILSKVDN